MKHKTILIILFALLSSCGHIIGSRDTIDSEETVIKWYQKEIILPDSLFQIRQSIKEKVCLSNALKSKVKLFSILGNDCSSCTIAQLLFWDRFIQEYEERSGFQLVLVYSGPNDYFCNVLWEDFGIQTPVLLDETGLITTMNSIFEYPEYNTILLDSENKVQLIGDFVNNKELYHLYIEEIDKHLAHY